MRRSIFSDGWRRRRSRVESNSVAQGPGADGPRRLRRRLRRRRPLCRSRATSGGSCKTTASCKACPTASCCSTPTTPSSGATAGCANGPGQEHRRRPELLRRDGQPRDPGPRLLSVPHRPGDRASQRFDRSAVRDNRYFRLHAAPVLELDRHAPQHLSSPSATSRTRCCSSKSSPPSTRPASSWPTSRPTTSPNLDYDERVDAAESQHPALHAGRAAFRRRRDSHARSRTRASWSRCWPSAWRPKPPPAQLCRPTKKATA